MIRTLNVLLMSTLAGCLVYDEPAPSQPQPSAGPTLTYADAGCYADDYYRDFVWYFEADADDANNGLDVTEVWADVYDDWNGEWVDGFELYFDSGITWYSAWVGESTWLDCTYSNYVVDFTAVSFDGGYDVVTVYPSTW